MKKYFLISIGTIALILGIIGIVLPILPTTPFMLLAAACYVNASPKLYIWLIEHKYLGKYIKNYREYRGIPLRAKIISIIMLWLGIGSSIIFFISLTIIDIFLLIVAVCVTIHLLSLKTIK